MEDSQSNIGEMEPDTQDIAPVFAGGTPAVKTNGNSSQTLFPESPVYEPEDDIPQDDNGASVKFLDEGVSLVYTEDPPAQKRKLTDQRGETSAKVQKRDLIDHEFTISSQSLDDEVSEITSSSKRKFENLAIPSTSRDKPVRSSPRKLFKRCNSADVNKPKTPRTPKSRPASVDVTKTSKTPRKLHQTIGAAVEMNVKAPSDKSTPKMFVKKIVNQNIQEIIDEENSEHDDSQNMLLVLSDTEGDEKSNDTPKAAAPSYSSDPVVPKNRKEVIDPGKVPRTHSEGYNYSELSNNLSQHLSDCKGKATDQESTDSVCSISMESPDHIPSVASKLISKLSNGNSSTPTEIADAKLGTEDSDSTPDMVKLNVNKGKRGKNESFRVSNTTTPSTISPLQNGHSLPLNTPQVPVFEVHQNYNEDCEFLSLVIVRTDNDIGMDIGKEYQRISKRFTIDPYLADVSVSNSPSSVTSGGMINLPNRTSFASTSTTSSNRTSDGNFVVPQPPRKSVTSNPTQVVKGYEALLKKVQDILSSHVREASDDGNRSLNDDKISVGVQASLSETSNLSNGNASPEEVSKCDKATPKSSLKKTRVKGRRHLAGKTKRAILPTQPEEPEYMHGMNSPEMVPTNGENGNSSPIKSPKDERPLSSLVGTPKSVNKLKQKKRQTSPRPATPVEKALVKTEYPGYAPDTVVLAKWVDKRYYSGRVLEITEPNKYLIKFDDGQSKTLLDDFIIFGDMKRLPLKGQSVYALVDEEQNYEPGLVLEVEENDSGTVTYRCTTDGDTLVMVTASELYLTEDQARSMKDSVRPHSPAAPATPRRRHHRELDLDNIIHGPRSARSRDKAASNSARKRVTSPKSPKASTSGVKSTKSTPLAASAGGTGRRRLASESSELSESSNSAPPARLEDVAGVEPELQRTPRKIDGVKDPATPLIPAGPLQLKGAAKQNVGTERKKNSKLAKFENDSDTVCQLGPIPSGDNKPFAGLHFLLTCTDTPRRASAEKCQETRHYSSEEDGETTSTMAGTDTEDLVFSSRPFHKERLKEQLEAGGGVVHSHFDDVPKNKYLVCKLIAPRPCLTAKYIQCLSADVRAVSHEWVIECCSRATRLDADAYALPAGWSTLRHGFVNWVPPSGKRNTSFFKDKLILLCFDQESFVKFWDRVCTLAGANTRVINEQDLNMTGALAMVTEWDCPHEVQNKANEDNIPLVSTNWVVQCLIEAKVIPPTSHDRFSFMYTEPE